MNGPFRLSDMQTKDVVNVHDGKNLGRVCDMELEGDSGQILHIVVPGKARFFGLFGHAEDRIILWPQIRLIGLDVILVDIPVYLENNGIKQSIWI